MEKELFTPESEAELKLCFPAFKELRPHLNEKNFIEQVQRQKDQTYNIIAIKHNGIVPSAAGFRFAEFLAWGKVLYIDDLTTLPEYRGQGYASEIMDWLIEYAKTKKCCGLHLDTGHHRHSAHKLYLKKGLSITSHHLSLEFE